MSGAREVPPRSVRVRAALLRAFIVAVDPSAAGKAAISQPVPVSEDGVARPGLGRRWYACPGSCGASDPCGCGVSTTLIEPRWANTTVFSDDVAAAIGELKAKPAGALQEHGSGILSRWLFDKQLVDELTLFAVPVVIRQGTQLLPDTGRDTALDLVESQATRRG